MIEEKWVDLEKGSCPNHYHFKVDKAYGGHCPATISFSQCAFDANDEALVAIDNNGMAYYVDLSSTPAFRKLGCVGISTFLAFNPTDRNEILIGLSSTNIKVLKIHSINDFCLLTGHTASPTNISFYKNYCLTCSSREVVVWLMKSYNKVHQLQLNAKELVIKKCVFSSIGIVAVLYLSDVIQAWTFQQFDDGHRIDVEKYGLRNVKDFDFTRDGRVMVVCGLQNTILIFNTSRWDLLKSIDINENFNGGRQVSVVSLPLDGGANSIAAVLTSDCSLKFISLTTSSIIRNCCELQSGLKRIIVSNKGNFLAYISKHGFIDFIRLDKVVSAKLRSSAEKLKEPRKLQISKAEDHLLCVQNAVKKELRLPRLLPILKEYGEYPEKHRGLIWNTLMELPNNKKAYIELSNKVPHEAMFELLRNDSLQEKYKSSLLSSTISCLLHWCPIIKECSYLPKLVAPFVNIFQKNPVLAFETMLFILLNFCDKWFEYHPLPPLNILGMVENILLEADPLLFNYFCERGVTATEYAWPLLQSLMSEVLSPKEWMILWDHLFSFQKPWFLLMCVVAYNILYRKTITTKLQNADEFKQFFITEGHVTAKSILKIAHKLDCETPHRIHPRRYLDDKFNFIPDKGPYLPFIQYQFPSYITDELRRVNLKKLKEKERRLRGFQLHALELLEEKRLRLESENFVRNIHEMRLNELRKCYENQVHEDERLLDFVKRDTKDLDPSCYLDGDSKWSNSRMNNRKSAADLERRRRKQRNSRSLQEQVDRLESEVFHLLATLQNKSSRSSRSRSKSRSRS